MESTDPTREMVRFRANDWRRRRGDGDSSGDSSDARGEHAIRLRSSSVKRSRQDVSPSVAPPRKQDTRETLCAPVARRRLRTEPSPSSPSSPSSSSKSSSLSSTSPSTSAVSSFAPPPAMPGTRGFAPRGSRDAAGPEDGRSEDPRAAASSAAFSAAALRRREALAPRRSGRLFLRVMVTSSPTTYTLNRQPPWLTYSWITHGGLSPGTAPCTTHARPSWSWMMATLCESLEPSARIDLARSGNRSDAASTCARTC